MDRDQSESFADHLVGTLTGGALTMLISLGYRVGLFEAAAGPGDQCRPGGTGSAGLTPAAELHLCLPALTAARAGPGKRVAGRGPGVVICRGG